MTSVAIFFLSLTPPLHYNLRMPTNEDAIRIDRLVRSKRRTLALQIDAGGRLIVRAPQRMPLRDIERHVQARADWIRKHQQHFRARPAPEHHYRPGERFSYLGAEYPLALVETARPALALIDGVFCLSRAALPRAGQVFTAWYRARAREVFTRRAGEHARRVGVSFENLRVSSARTRWGSCSNQRTLSFTWRLVMAPPEAIDYVVIHELAHLQVRGHSRDFWALVARWMPAWQPAAAWLKENGYKLSL